MISFSQPPEPSPTIKDYVAGLRERIGSLDKTLAVARDAAASGVTTVPQSALVVSLEQQQDDLRFLVAVLENRWPADNSPPPVNNPAANGTPSPLHFHYDAGTHAVVSTNGQPVDSGQSTNGKPEVNGPPPADAARVVSEKLTYTYSAITEQITTLQTFIAGLFAQHDDGLTTVPRVEFANYLGTVQATLDVVAEDLAGQIVSAYDRTRENTAPASDASGPSIPAGMTSIDFIASKVSEVHGHILDRIEHMEERLKAMRAMKESGTETVDVTTAIELVDSIQGANCQDFIILDKALTAIRR